jgi:radical SAM protein with 4Fe4S-binding SPASM domain
MPSAEREAIKQRNEALLRDEFRAQSPTLRGRPLFLQLETTNRCDCACRICERTYRRVPPRDLDPRLLDRLERDVFPYLRDSSIQGFGEPLLDPCFEDVLDRLTAHGIHTGFVTNGRRLTCERLERYIRLGVCLTVSLDGATAATYARIRGRDDFDRVIEVLEGTGELKRRYPDSGAELRLNFVATTSNVDELPAMVELAERLGADGLEVLNLLTVRLPPEIAALSLSRDPERANRRFREAAERARGSTVALTLPPPFDTPEAPFDPSSARNYVRWPKIEGSRSPYPNTCCDPWMRLFVSAEGDARACCVWPYSLGNLLETPFEEVWNGTSYRKVRRRVNSRFPQSPCKECPLWYGINAGRKEAVDRTLPWDCRLHTAAQRLARLVRRRPGRG